MKCMYCGTPLSSIDYCTGCGADVTIQKRTNRISNLLYNEGLEKASVRDLSGAISCLKRSLKFNKENVDARNLLGLVYYETGEVVAALSEWVISNNTVPENNPANFYISKLQENKNKLDMINQTIRKYNQALDYCKQHDEDMALIQLKKVLAQNPNLIKGYHLLALIYLKDQEYEKARKVLKKAAQIDTTNTMTLRYLHEVEEATGVGTNLNTKTKRFRKKTDAEEKVPKILGPLTYMNGNDTVIQPTTFRDSSTAATFLNIFLGFLLGAAVVWFLAIPANTRKINQQASAQVTDANTKLAASTSQIDSLQAKIDEYQAQVDAANSTADSANTKAQSYDSLLKAASEFLSGNQTGTASAMADIKADSLTDSAKTLYDLLMNSVKSTVYSNLYTEGTTAYASGNYATAAEKLKEATETDATQYDAWYYLGFAYYNQGDTANADKTFAYIVNNFPASAGEVSQYITNSAALNSTDAAQTSTEAGQTAENGQTAAAQETVQNAGAVQDTGVQTYDQTYNQGYDQTAYDQTYYNQGYDQTYTYDQGTTW